MTRVVTAICESCGRVRRPEDLLCGLCGRLFRRAEARRAGDPGPMPVAATAATAAPRRAPQRRALPAGAVLLAAGVPVALALGFLPLLRYMGWFLSALVHEMGHAAAAWACGMPAVPAIRLDGHAAAVHGEQMLFLCVVAVGVLVHTAFRLARPAARGALLAVALLVYPALAFSGAREVLHLAAGHGAELAFAALAFWRAVTGGFTESSAERVLYAGLGWYLLGSNLALTLGLMTSAAARAHYASNGSFGFTNDYLRLAGDHLGVPLELVAAAMTLAAVAVLPAALVLARMAGRRVVGGLGG